MPAAHATTVTLNKDFTAGLQRSQARAAQRTHIRPPEFSRPLLAATGTDAESIAAAAGILFQARDAPPRP